MVDFDALALDSLKATLKPETWGKRLELAQAHAQALEAIDEARRSGASEGAALAQFAPDWHRSTYHGRRRRYLAGGKGRLINRRPGKVASKVMGDVRLVICTLRRLDPHIAVERIAEVVQAQCRVSVSATSIKRVLVAEGLNRPPGGGSRRPPIALELQFAGAEFFKIADLQLGYSAALAQTITELRDAVPEAQEEDDVPGAAAQDGRNAHGCFTAAYNQARSKGDTALGPAFRSVDELRLETDLHARRLVHEQPETIHRKVLALLALPLLTETGKAIQLDDYRGGCGVAEFGGTRYRGDTLDRCLRDLKYLAAGPSLTQFHAEFWHGQEAGPGADDPAALCIYIDGVGKPLWTQHFTRAGKVSATGRVMPCLDQVLIHTGMGTPIFWQSFSGHASLVNQTLPLLEKLEAVVGQGWMADRLTVIDGEGNSVALFKRFEAQDRHFITILRDNQVKRPEDVADRSDWQPYREGDEIAEGTVSLADRSRPERPSEGPRKKADRLAPFLARAVLVRRRRKGTLTVLVSNAPGDDYSGRQIADAYFARWPRQELRFRTFNQGAKFKRVHGYGKRAVQNVTVLTDLDKLRAKKERLREKLARQADAAQVARQNLVSAKLRLNAAKARRALQDGLLDETIESRRPRKEALKDRVDVARTERGRYEEANSGVLTAAQKLDVANAKLQALQAKLPALDAEMAELDTRKEIFQADTELDQIMTVFKLGFALLCETAMRMFFPGRRMSLHGFIRQILALPGTRTIEGKVDHIRIKASPNKEIMAAVEAACHQANELGIARDGRTVKLSVDWPPGARKQRANGE